MNAIARLVMAIDHMLLPELQEVSRTVLKYLRLFACKMWFFFLVSSITLPEQAKNRKGPLPLDLDEFGQR